MGKVLVIAEHHDGKLNAATAKTVSAALALKADSIDVLVLAADPAAVATVAAQIGGVARVLTVTNPANANAIAQVLAPQIAAVAAGYSHVLGPSTTFGKDLMPCVAALLGTAQVSDVMSVEGSHTFKRPIYAGNAIITVEAPADHTVVATVRSASWPEAAKGGNAAIERALAPQVSDVGSADHDLGWDAANIDAGAAEGAALDQGHARPLLDGFQRCRHRGGAAADHGDVQSRIATFALHPVAT